MRYPASEKLEIIRLVEQSHIPVRRTLEQIGVPRATFYRWYDLYQTGGPEALEDRSPRNLSWLTLRFNQTRHWQTSSGSDLENGIALLGRPKGTATEQKSWADSK